VSPAESDFNAAVAVLFDGGSILLIKRKERPGDPWSGDIAFPGGFRKGDETGEQTASRECVEESGIMPAEMKFLGRFSSLHGNVSVNAYFSRVGRSDPAPGEEVQSAFWAPVTELADSGGSYRWGGHVIWGLTYRIIRQLLSIDGILS
jgi:ADP-ribose pyrophosphatase YjhB (NUDIX family)